jgi:hypothetical protein
MSFARAVQNEYSLTKAFFLYCTVPACDVRADTLIEGFPCFFLSCKANTRV